MTLQHANANAALVYALNRCIEIQTDCEKSYAAAAADVREPAMKNRFIDKAKERSRFVVALQSAIGKLGAFSENEGTARGAAMRVLEQLRLAVEGRDDALVLAEWARFEHEALRAFEGAVGRLDAAAMPKEVRTMLEEHRATMMSALEETKAPWPAIRRELGPFCQSCSMPLRQPEDFGTAKEGFRVNEYCRHCYAGGAFTDPEITMRQMIDRSVPIMVQQGMQEQAARGLLEEVMPKFKRWRERVS